MYMHLTGYNNVAVIPKGASNIRIEQHGFGRSKEDGIYLGETPTTVTCCVCLCLVTSHSSCQLLQ